MKKVIQLSVLASVLSIVFVACGNGDKAKKNIDSLATSTSTKVVDTVKKDTSGKIISSKKDSTVVTKTDKKTSN